MDVNRKNRAYELRLALLNTDTPASGFTGGRLSASVGRVSRYSGHESTSRPPPSTAGSSVRGVLQTGQRRPHRLPELGETDVRSNSGPGSKAVVSVTNLRLGNSQSPLPPITSPSQSEHGRNESRGPRTRQHGPPPPPLDTLKQKERQVRSTLQTAKTLSDPGEEALLLQQLGDLALQTAYHSGSAGDLVRAAALYNTALLGCGKDDDQKIRVRSRLIEAERQLLQQHSCCSSVVIEKYLAMDTGARDNRRLAQIRREVKEALKVAGNRLEDIRDDPDGNAHLKGKFVEDMTLVAQMAQKTVFDVLQHMMTTCKAVLGEPPCRYAVLAIGPLVAGYGDPYHMPLEYIILVGNDEKPSNIEYFHNFCHYIHLKILNLGETSLFRCGVQTFEDAYNENFHCFQDVQKKTGLYLDLSLHSDAITPLMCVEGDRVLPEAEHRVAAFLGAPWRVVGQLDQGMLGDVGYSIITRLLHYTLIDGDRALVEDYKTEITHLLNRTEHGRRNHENISCNWLMSLLQEPEPAAVINNGLSSFYKVQLERDLGLVPQILGALKINHNIGSVHTWDIVDSLVKKSALTKEDSEGLKYANSLSYYLSLKASLKANYSHTRKQSTSSKVNGQITDNTIQGCLMGRLSFDDSVITSWAVHEYYQVLVPCWTCLYQKAKDYSSLSLLDCHLFNNNLKVQALAYDRLGDRCNAIRTLLTETTEVASLTDPSRTVLLYDLYVIQGLEHLQVGKNGEARNCFNKTMELKEQIDDAAIKSVSFVNSWHNFGLLQLLAGKYDKALEQLTEGVNLSRELLTGSDQYRLKDQFEAGVYENIAHVQICLGMLTGALKSFEISLRLREQVSMHELVSDISRELHYRMGCLYLMLGDHKSALNLLIEALDIHLFLPTNVNYPTLWDAMILTQISKAHDEMGNLSCAAAYRLQVRRMCNLLCNQLGLDEDMTSIDMNFESVCSVNILYELGRCLLYTGESRLALIVFDSLQSQLESSVKYVKGKRAGLVDLPQVILCKGEALSILERTESACASYKQMASLCEVFYSDKAKPSHLIATCYKRLGTCLLQLGSHQEASAKLDMALQLYRFSYGDKQCHPDICDVVRAQGICQREVGEYRDSVITLQRCLELENQTFGSSHIRVGRCQYEIGLTFYAEGLYESAMNYFEHAMEVYRKLDLGSDTCVEEVPKLYIGRARCHVALGRIQQAERCWERAVNKARVILEREPSRSKAFIRLLKLCADFYHQIERWDHAVRIRREVLDLVLNKEGIPEDSTEVCSAIFAIGREYSASGNTDEATRAFEKAIRLRRRTAETEEEKLELAGWLSELGQSYAKAGEQERSSECHLESLYLKKNVLGQGTVDEDVIASLETIAGVHERRGELKQALALRKQSLIKNLQLHGEDVSPALIDTVERVATAFQRIGEHDSALRHWKDALSLRPRLDEGERPMNDTAHVYRECGHCYEGLGQYERAIEQYQKGLKILQSHNTGHSHDMLVALTIGDIGKALNSLGRSQEAVDNLMTASIKLRTLISDTNEAGETILHLATVLRHLGLAYETCGEGGRAHDCYTESVCLLDRLGGPEPSKEKADCLRALGKLQCSAGEHESGASLLEKALVEYRRMVANGTGSADIASTLEELGETYTSLQNDSLTLKYLNEALQVLRQVYGHKRPHLQVARCLGSVAAVCSRAGRHGDTVAYARQALAMYATILPENADHPELVVLNELLGDCYWAMGQYEDCLGYYKKASQVCLYLHNGDALHADVVNVIKKLQSVQQQLGRSH